MQAWLVLCLQDNKKNIMNHQGKHIKNIWVVGGGRFGQIALERITKQLGQADVTLIDKKPLSLPYPHIKIVQSEGVTWVDRMLKESHNVDLIVPALPVHLMVEWLKLQFNQEAELLLPVSVEERWLKNLPNPYLGEEGRVYVSHADFICPDYCPEPECLCTYTGESRPTSLCQFLGELEFKEVDKIIIRSHQLLPGVGGVYPSELWDVYKRVRKSLDPVIMLGTACRCHGVVDFLRYAQNG